MHDLKLGSDIDLFVVAKKGRLFTCRLWLTFLTQIFGVRRHGSKTHKRFCLSFLVEEGFENLEEIAIKDDIYLAKWIKTLHPIAGELKGYELFLKKNRDWLKPLVGDLEPQDSEFKAQNLFQKLTQSLLSISSVFLESPLRKWQIKRAKLKASKLSDQSGTIITEHRLKFHDKDMREDFKRKWNESNSDSISQP
jgi:hypothetical protein